MIKNILFIVVILILWLAFIYKGKEVPEDQFPIFEDINPARTELSAPEFDCLGKKYCSEMDSCEEAKFYLRNCPDTELDPDGDGLPCEEDVCANY